MIELRIVYSGYNQGGQYFCSTGPFPFRDFRKHFDRLRNLGYNPHEFTVYERTREENEKLPEHEGWTVAPVSYNSGFIWAIGDHKYSPII